MVSGDMQRLDSLQELESGVSMGLIRGWTHFKSSSLECGVDQRLDSLQELESEDRC